MVGELAHNSSDLRMVTGALREKTCSWDCATHFRSEGGKDRSSHGLNCKHCRNPSGSTDNWICTECRFWNPALCCWQSLLFSTLLSFLLSPHNSRVQTICPKTKRCVVINMFEKLKSFFTPLPSIPNPRRELGPSPRREEHPMYYSTSAVKIIHVRSIFYMRISHSRVFLNTSHCRADNSTSCTGKGKSV